MILASMLTLAMLVGFNGAMALNQALEERPYKFSLYGALVIFGLLLIDFSIYLIHI